MDSLFADNRPGGGNSSFPNRRDDDDTCEGRKRGLLYPSWCGNQRNRSLDLLLQNGKEELPYLSNVLFLNRSEKNEQECCGNEGNHDEDIDHRIIIDSVFVVNTGNFSIFFGRTIPTL